MNEIVNSIDADKKWEESERNILLQVKGQRSNIF